MKVMFEASCAFLAAMSATVSPEAPVNPGSHYGRTYVLALTLPDELIPLNGLAEGGHCFFSGFESACIAARE